MQPSSPALSSATRRQFLRSGGAAALFAVGGSSCRPKWLAKRLRGNGDLAAFLSPDGETPDLVSHVISRLSWGVSPGDYTKVAAMGSTPEAAVQSYIQQQLNPPAKADPGLEITQRVRALETIHQPVGELYDTSPRQLNFELTSGALLRFAYSPWQLYEVMVSFWTDHFNIDNSKSECRWLKALDDREVIRKHALGNFRQLLQASALSPAMLFYLDGRANIHDKPDAKPNENYARELLELHTLGVTGGYSQDDIMNVAKCLTGWTVNGKEATPGVKKMGALQRVKNFTVALASGGTKGDPNYGLGRVHFIEKHHIDGEKHILGTRVQCDEAKKELDAVLDIVAAHPSTAKFIATKLCRRFIADEPPQAAVEATAKTFLTSGGDIKATLTTLFATPEFLGTRGTKFKRPLHWYVSAIRATGAYTQAGSSSQRYLRRAGQMPFEYPTPDGYQDTQKDWTPTLLARWDFAVRLANGKLEDTTLNATTLLKAAGGRQGTARHLFGRKPYAHEMEAMSDISKAVENPATADAQTLAILLASPAFQQY